MECKIKRSAVINKLAVGSDIWEVEPKIPLKYSEEIYYKIFNLSPNMMAIYCLEDDLCYQDVNQRFCQITCYSKEEILHKRIKDFKIFDYNLFSWLEPQFKREGKIDPVEIKFYDRFGNEHTGILSAEVLELNKKKYLLCALKDISELKNMEHEIARLDRLNIVGELAACIGHEVRNPMTAVNGFLQMFIKKEEYKQDKEIIELMIEELNRANQIITDFLSLAKEKEANLEINNLNKVIEKLSPLIISKAMSEDKVVEFSYGETPDIMLDEKEIRQLIFNLVQNGLDVIETGKKIAISTYYKNNEVILAIRDQGPGINKEILKKIGTPFFTTKEKGTGLGLCVCYSIAARHNAIIDIDTSENGTCFHIKFKAS